MTTVLPRRSSVQLGKTIMPWVSLLLITVSVLLPNLNNYPAIWLDEGYKMNAARTLADDGIYGTYTVNGFKPFDPGISSGPADIIPIALVYKLFGNGIIQARGVALLYTLLLVLMLYVAGERLFGSTAAMLSLLILLLLPWPYDRLLIIGRQALGEGPALALILSGILIWLRQAESPGVLRGVSAGLLLGLGLLSKTQFGIALLPALVLTLLVRNLKHPRGMLLDSIPCAVMLAVFAGWSYLGQILTDPVIYADNQARLLDAVATNLLTGLWGRTIGPTGLPIILVMLCAMIISMTRLWRARANWQQASWQLEFCLSSFVAGTLGWFVLFSVGWPRYAYAGLIIAELLIFGGLICALQQMQHWRTLRGMLIAGIICGLLWNWFSIQPFDQEIPEAERMASFIDQTIADNAVIESWEWEMSALTRHRAYHFPDQYYMFLSIRQYWHQRTAFDLQYEILQASPDYLLIGDFGSWTNIYTNAVVSQYFRPLHNEGRYRLYERIDVAP